MSVGGAVGTTILPRRSGAPELPLTCLTRVFTLICLLLYVHHDGRQIRFAYDSILQDAKYGRSVISCGLSCRSIRISSLKRSKGEQAMLSCRLVVLGHAPIVPRDWLKKHEDYSVDSLCRLSVRRHSLVAASCPRPWRETIGPYSRALIQLRSRLDTAASASPDHSFLPVTKLYLLLIMPPRAL